MKSQQADAYLIEDAIYDMYMDSNDKNLNRVISAVFRCMLHNENFLIPIDKKKDGAVKQVSTGGNSEVGGDMWLAAFTSREQLGKVPVDMVVEYSIGEFLQMALNAPEDVNGILLNPFGRNFSLTKEMCRTILESEIPENRVKFAIGDITQLDCDCIVCGTEQILGGGAVAKAVRGAAGSALEQDRDEIAKCAVGDAVITKGYGSYADFIIHTCVGRWQGREEDGDHLLSCYTHCLDLAARFEVHSIAFPLLGTGVGGFPPQSAALNAMIAALTWTHTHPQYGMTIIFCCRDQNAYNTMQQAIEIIRHAK